PNVPGTILRGLLTDSPRHLTAGFAKIPHTRFPAQNPAFATPLRGRLTSSPRRLAPGRPGTSHILPPTTTLDTPLHWAPTRSPRRAPAGWAKVPHTVSRPSSPDVPGTILRGLQVKSPRRLRPGDIWIPTQETPQVFGAGTPIHGFTVSSP